MQKNHFYFLILILALILIAFGINKLRNKPEFQENQNIPVVMENPELSNSNQEEEKPPEETSSAIEKENIPLRFSNSVPFTSQAPYAKWDNLHDEACEEASIIMAHYYLADKEEIPMREAEDAIQEMVEFQMGYFGSHKDLNADEMVDLAEEFYKEKYQVIDLLQNVPEETEDEADSLDFIYKEKIDYLKSELAKGNIFIIPAAGQELRNPYFRGEGPLYHALVITGYDDSAQEFITNDPGTRRGEKYRYSYEILWSAIHDFPGKKTEILTGDKKVILVEKLSD